MSQSSSKTITSSIPAVPQLRRAEIVAIGLFVVANILVPVIWGDIFPFTSSPMFRDAPRAYCVYRVITPDGTELDAATLLMQRVYDGNPPGYGVGIAPPATLARFGEIASEAEIRQHLLQHSSVLAKYAYVTIEQDVIGCVDGKCTVKQTNRFRVEQNTP